jgi:hypothetical protein
MATAIKNDQEDQESVPTRSREQRAVLDISTEVDPPKLIKIDGEDYQLLGFDHLSPEEESEVTAAFARFQTAFTRLDQATSDKAATQEAIKLRRKREQLIGLMTTVPREVISKLTTAKQGQLLRAIQDEIGQEAGPDAEDEDGGDSGAEE